MEKTYLSQVDKTGQNCDFAHFSWGQCSERLATKFISFLHWNGSRTRNVFTEKQLLVGQLVVIHTRSFLAQFRFTSTSSYVFRVILGHNVLKFTVKCTKFVIEIWRLDIPGNPSEYCPRTEEFYEHKENLT